MEGIERIHELMEQLMEECQKVFPAATSLDCRMSASGYRTFQVHETKRDPDAPVEDWKRRTLWDQTKCSGYGWDEDESNRLNAFYAEKKVLLTEG